MPARTIVPQPVPATGPATEILFARLTREDIDQISARLSDDNRALWESASPSERKRLALAFGLQHGVPGVAEHTGLSAADPPLEVHSVVRGVLLETGGSYYYADLVLECLDAVGQKLAPGDRVLDFSCSSGRVVRALSAARPDVYWHGCDPNDGAINWARQHAPGIQFFVSNTSPSLPFDDGFYDAVFAVSVWSHYSPAAALRWLEEMHRMIKPGGHLIFTTHGLQACVWFGGNHDPAIEAKLGANWVLDTTARLEQGGHCFWNVFGEHGDWGVVDSDWGLAFFTPEWLLENVTPAWALGMYRIGRADGNQDVFALERK